ncbi:MAG TPA: phosphotransferase, partial [Polyangiaceae bacterium]|nr:phosphotransferase [Polyangiaceae bacterium]
SMTDLEACLPARLRGTPTTITRIAAGLSGAGVYRVERAGQVFVLKVSAAGETLADWHAKLHLQGLAASAGLAPALVHADEAERATLSDFVADRGFRAFYANPETREAALTSLGRMLRRMHELPLPAGAPPKDPLAFLALLGSALAGFALPAFVEEAIQRVRAEPPPPREQPLVLSHNDVNPTNLVYDGENLLLLDWDTAGPNDASYDLATLAVFLRMDEGTCRALSSAYQGRPVAELSASFAYHRRLVAALCGSAFLHLARQGGHAGASGTESLGAVPALGDVYQSLRSGALSLAVSEGQWWFGLALTKASLEL